MIRLPAAQRMTWMDVCRGVAIGLVILWHSGAILELFDYPMPEGLRWFNELFSPYRMPTLMFLSGMLLPSSLRKPLGRYYLGKLRFVAYPLVIWTVIHHFQYSPERSLLDPIFWSTAYLWFLLYILVFYLGAPLLRWIPAWVVVPLALFATFFIGSEQIRRFFFLAVFFFLGDLATRHRSVLDRTLASRWTWLLAPVALGFGIVSATTTPDRYLGMLAVFSLAGIIVLLKLAQVAAPHAWSRPVQYVGRHSLIYYITHFPVILLAVELLERRLGLPIDLVIAIGFVLALAVGTAAAWLAEHTPVRWAFIAPARGDLARFRRRGATAAEADSASHLPPEKSSR